MDDVIGGCGTRLTAELPDETILVHAGLVRQFVERRDVREIVVDGPESVDDALVADGCAQLGLGREVCEEHVQQSVDFHLRGLGSVLEGLDYSQHFRRGLVGGGVAVLQGKVGRLRQQVAYDALIHLCGRYAEGQAVLLVELIDLHGGIQEVQVVVAEAAVAVVAVAGECRDEIEIAGRESVCVPGEGHLAASFGHPIDPGERAADVFEVPVAIILGISNAE